MAHDSSPNSLMAALGSSAESAQPENLLHACGQIMAQGIVEQFGWMFYYVKPNSSIFGNVDDVPNYEVQVGLFCFVIFYRFL